MPSLHWLFWILLIRKENVFKFANLYHKKMLGFSPCIFTNNIVKEHERKPTKCAKISVLDKKYLFDPSLPVTAHNHHESQSGRVIKSRWAKSTQKRTGDCCWGGERRGWWLVVKICTILAVASFSRARSGGGGPWVRAHLFPPVICALTSSLDKYEP